MPEGQSSQCGSVMFTHDAEPDRWWPAIRLGDHRNNNIPTPIVTREVAESVLHARATPFTVTADAELVVQVDGPDDEAITIAPNAAGEYDLAALGFLFHVDE